MRTVKVSFGLTKNLGNYESARIDMEYGRDIDSDEDPREVSLMLLADIKRDVFAEASKLITSGKR